jgi:hypothetical protein
MLTSTKTELTLAVRWHVRFNHRSSQVRDVTEKFDRTFLVSVLQFPIRGTHSTKRLNSALNAFG